MSVIELEPCISVSGSSLLEIVDVEPDVDGPVPGDELRDIAFEKFLELDRQFADPLAAHVVVPLDDLAAFAPAGIFLDPGRHGPVLSAGGDELPESFRGQTGEIEEEIVEGTVELVFPQGAGNGCPALVEGAGGNNIAPQRFARTTGRAAGSGKIRGLHSDRFRLVGSRVKLG